MSDERLREAERLWKETGSAGDEARFLTERMRLGELTQERLELAASCGNAGAQLALEGRARQGPALNLDEGPEVDAFLSEFCIEPIPTETQLQLSRRISVAATRRTFGASEITLPEHSLTRLAQLAGEAYPAHPELLAGLEETGLRLVEESLFPESEAHNVLLSVRDAFRQGFYALSDWQHAVASCIGCALATPEEALSELASCLCACINEVSGNEDWDRAFPTSLSQGINAELVPWLLGYGDPVRERIEARSR